MGLIAGLVAGLLVRPPNMARRAGLLLMPLGFLGALAWGPAAWALSAGLSPVEGASEVAGLAAFVASWLAMGVVGLLMWRARERIALGFVLAALFLTMAACLIWFEARDPLPAMMALMMALFRLPLLGCALALLLGAGRAPDSLSGRPTS